MHNIVVPALGESVTEAIVARWIKKTGETVQVDEAIVELETDKVSLEVTAQVAGVISNIKANEGDTVAVGAILGVIDESGKASVVVEKVSSAPQEKKASKLAPSVERLAAENKLNLEQIQASGKGGRLTKSDVVEHMQTSSRVEPSFGSSAAALQPQFIPSEAQPGEERVKMSRLRQKIGERLKEAQNTAAILTTFNEVDMTEIMSLRKNFKDSFEKKHGARLGFMSFFVRAVIQALKEIPIINARVEGDEIVYNNFYDIGVAVSAPQGLVVPVLRNADRLSFAAIEQMITEMGLKAKDGKLSIQELTGGTFTISNGGVFGSLVSTPILNPPQSAILGMHKIQERPVVLNGQIVARPMMYLALSYDHRIIDGREAVTFLVRVKEMLEMPERLMLEV